jgi:SAM-dependent methyltransferase
MNKASSGCRFCGTELRHVFADLGVTPLANQNLSRDQITLERKYPLVVRVCDACFLVQVDHSVSPDALFSDYDYFSSYSDSWIEHARQYCDLVRARFSIGPQSFVVEIASNDGYLLQHFEDVGVLGVEPAANVARVAIAKGIPTDVAFFGVDTAKRIVARGRHADLVVANNVLAHAPDIRDFVGGFAVLLAGDGVATFEFPHLLRLIEGGQFDTIYHEHFFYLSLLTVERVMHAAGLRVFDVEELTTHGGSLRVFACRSTATHATTSRVDALRASERDQGLDRIAGYEGFASRIDDIKAQFLAYLASARASGRKVAAYGAAAKGNTFLNVCGVAYPQIEAVYDRSAAKQGKFTPGSHIPILAPEQIGKLKPDDVIVLPWNISDEVVRSMSFIREWGGRFVVAVPNLKIL